jgi:hypothetical protein
MEHVICLRSRCLVICRTKSMAKRKGYAIDYKGKPEL